MDLWPAVDDYIAGTLHRRPEDNLEGVREANAAAGLPSIDVSAPQGKLLHVLALAMGARQILEIGTLGGYSTIWFARALPPGGRVVTLEIDPRHAEAAQANFAHAGVADRIELRLGPALETLPKLAAEGYGPFDIVFIDADKPNNAEYLKWGVRLARPRTLIICDNIVRDGEVADPDNPDANVRGARAFIDLVARDPRLTGTVIQTVGSKGYDGFAIAVVLASQ